MQTKVRKRSVENNDNNNHNIITERTIMRTKEVVIEINIIVIIKT